MRQKKAHPADELFVVLCGCYLFGGVFTAFSQDSCGPLLAVVAMIAVSGAVLTWFKKRS